MDHIVYGYENLVQDHKVEPCPFCGTKANLKMLMNPEKGFFVHCSHCKVDGPAYSWKNIALDLWNNRKPAK